MLPRKFHFSVLTFTCICPIGNNGDREGRGENGAYPDRALATIEFLNYFRKGISPFDVVSRRTESTV